MFAEAPAWLPAVEPPIPLLSASLPLSHRPAVALPAPMGLNSNRSILHQSLAAVDTGRKPAVEGIAVDHKPAGEPAEDIVVAVRNHIPVETPVEDKTVAGMRPVVGDNKAVAVELPEWSLYSSWMTSYLCPPQGPVGSGTFAGAPGKFVAEEPDTVADTPAVEYCNSRMDCNTCPTVRSFQGSWRNLMTMTGSNSLLACRHSYL